MFFVGRARANCGGRSHGGCVRTSHSASPCHNMPDYYPRRGMPVALILPLMNEPDNSVGATPYHRCPTSKLEWPSEVHHNDRRVPGCCHARSQQRGEAAGCVCA